VKRVLAIAAAIACSGLMWGGAATATAATSTALVPGGAPMVRAAVSGSGEPTISENWSGYAATSTKKFTYVHSEFVQPAVKCPGVKDQFTSNWVGLDGFADNTVEQDGTFAFCGGPTSTTPEYVAWYEMFPAGSVEVFPVKPGDVIDASVDYTAGQFVLTVSDLSTGKTATDTAACASCERASAEWIVERPAGCNASFTKCFLFALADFGNTTMSEDIARTAGSRAEGISGFYNYPIYMVSPLKRGFISLDAPGPVDNATDSFPVTWYRAGTPIPITFGPRG